ncbi:methylated-DNA--[protein]-cysteine S-methyltransferase [Roseococcus sp. YIM B11640]|uniref:methylated-DNA--[protein]-cysteine S-methyltransferase n=1 Tax=Roseococcus sp. YIM B11640 TaxID=3133973 RepID=UPI003C7C8D3A
MQLTRRAGDGHSVTPMAAIAAPGLWWLHVESPLGRLRLAAGEAGLAAVLWPGEDGRRVPVTLLGEAPEHPVLREAARQLGEYFAGTRHRFGLPLAATGTLFQRAVWEALPTIPAGETMSYGQMAARLGRPAAARAVGAANGRNPLSIIWPCHRLVGADASLTGFAGGLEAKAWLLAHERKGSAPGG